ncbi:hypothetical protein [Synechococcus sp. H55.11]|uniref:hypothetical protein n=1 Tax=unclassified Synechococcus TaxID=2626047 RepID=UPI0039C3BC9B
MADSVLLKADDKETAVAIGDQIYFPSVLHSAILITFLQISHEQMATFAAKKIT